MASSDVDAQILWIGNGTNFNDGQNWNGGVAPGGNDVAAFKTISPPSQPSVAGDATVGGLYFTVSGYTLGGSRTVSLAGTGTAEISAGGSSNAAPAIQADNTSGVNTIAASLSLAPTSGTTSTFYQNTGGTLVISGFLSGLGVNNSLTKIGGGSLTLSNQNSYSGGTTLNAGTLALGSSFDPLNFGGRGPVGTGTLTLNAGTLSSDSTAARSTPNAIVFGGDVTFGTSTNFGALTLSGGGTLTGSRTLTLVADVTLSGNIGQSGGSYGITKNGTGALILSGNNNYSGGTTANNGLLWVRSNTALGSSSGSLTVNAGTSNGAIVDLSGNSISVGNLTGSGGNIWNNLNGTNTTATLTIGNGNTGGGNYQGVISNNNGASNGLTALTKIGTGTITLSGANTYSGGTAVNGGTLLINTTGSSNSGTGGGVITVGSSGTLGGSGFVNAGSNAVTVNGAIRGGVGTSTADTLTVTGTVSMGSNSVIQLALGASGAHSTLALGSGSSMSFQAAQQFTFIDLGAAPGMYDNIITGVNTTSGATFVAGQITNPGWTGVFSYDATNQAIDLNLIAVPETSTWLGSLLAAAVIAAQFVRRRSQFA